MKTTHQNTVYPQTVEIPEPLEIHPSVDPELARGLIAAVEYIDKHPLEFYMGHGLPDGQPDCVICHAERLSSWKRSPSIQNWLVGKSGDIYPLGDARRIFSPSSWCALCMDYNTTAGRIARISHFLSTGQ